ncbi:WD40 repeat-like protein [Haematococcus lacustris]
MNFKFSNLLGAPYRGGNLIIHGNELLTPVGNRVSQINLAESTSQTLPFENLKQIQTLCLSPDGVLLLSIDAEGRALLVNRKRKALLHHFSFKGPVSVAKFSPDGRFLAAGVGRLVQVWVTPSFEKQLAPMQLHRTYGQCHSQVVSLDWSPDSQFIACASKDIVARVFSLHPIEGYEPPALSGHKDGLVAVFFTGPATRQAALVEGRRLPVLCTLSRDGALFTWTFTPSMALQVEGEEDINAQVMPFLAGGAWSLGAKDYLNQRGARVSSAAFHQGTGLLVVGMSTGLFDIYQMPGFENIQTLSISREKISALAWNPSGDWLAVGCAKLGQLLVWEWRSDSYVLKQQGHVHDICSVAFSPDGALLATGSDDRKVKLFQVSSGFCFVTFTDHTAPVTAVSFLPSGHALVSASLDGTVRAFDLVRYRNFRTMTSPSPVQFVCVAVDAGGEVVAAGTADSFQIYVWSLRTGRLLDVLAGHEGPVCCLAFSATSQLLASGSWDKTVRTWDVFSGGGTVEALQHSHDVLALAFRPDGKQLAVATLNGDITLWDPNEAAVQHTIEGRRDIKGGRLSSDRRAAGNLASGASFTSLTYSADGAFLTAGGSSRYVVIYDVAERVMLRRFAVTSNRSLDGVLDMLNSKHLTDAGPLQLIDAEGPDADDAELLPPMLDAAAAADVPGAGKGKRPSARTRSLALSPTGRCWAAATTEGVVLYSLDDDMLFDPTDLSEDLTPATCRKALAAGAHLRALLIALRLRDSQLLRACVFGTPAAQVVSVAAGLPAVFLPPLVQALAQYISSSPHLEFVLKWAHALCTQHGSVLEAAAGGAGRNATVAAAALPSLRLLQKALSQMHEDLSASCESNLYTLEYLLAAGSGAAKGASSKQTGDNAVDKQANPHDTTPGDALDVRAEQSSSDNDDSDVVPLVSVGRIGGAAAEGRSSLLLGLDAGQEDEQEEADGAANDEAGCMPGWG